jgi:phage-related protein
MTSVSDKDKPLVWRGGEVKTPPLSSNARLEMGFLLRRLQRGDLLGMPASRPMPSIGSRCHELRVTDAKANWRLVYRVDADAVVVLEVFAKKTQATPKAVIDLCQKRLKEYDRDKQNESKQAKGAGEKGLGGRKR